MGIPTTLKELEDLFLDKYLEKYRLTDRDLKRAFGRFDKNRNGSLDVGELTQAISEFLNGVDQRLVMKLVKKYDSHGRNCITFEEFQGFLVSRSALNSGEAPSSPSAGPLRLPHQVPHRAPSAGSTPPSRHRAAAPYADSPHTPPAAGKVSEKYNKGAPFATDNNNSAYSEGSADEPDAYADDEESEWQRPPPRASARHRSAAPGLPAPRQETNPQTKTKTKQHASARAGHTRGEHTRREYLIEGGIARERRLRVRGGDDEDEDASDADLDSQGQSALSELPPSEASESESYYDARSEVASEPVSELEGVATGDYSGIEARAAVFLQNLYGHLSMRARQMRSHVQMSTRLSQDKLTMADSIAARLLVKELSEQSQDGSGVVGHNEFRRVLAFFNSFFKGATPLRTEVVDFLFDLCAEEDSGSAAGAAAAAGAGVRTRHTRVVVKPASVAKVMLDAAARRRLSTTHAGSKVRPSLRTKPIQALSKDMTSLQLNTQQEDPAAQADRFLHPKSRTPFVKPASFTEATVRRSSAAPQNGLVKDHCFGITTDVHGGNAIHCLTGSAAANNVGKNDVPPLVYASAGSGVVHHTGAHTQLFFDGHDDNISCIAVSDDGSLAATGQVGKRPVVRVWDTERPEDGALATIGEGFFERGVNCCAFSGDGVVLVAVSEDDHHSLGVWDVRSGRLLAQSTAQNGIPPQIRAIQLSPLQQYTEFITREHDCPCDVLVTAGTHHLRFWSFRRPQANGLGGDVDGREPSLKFKGGVYPRAGPAGGGLGGGGAVPSKTPSLYSCAAFVSPPADKNRNVAQRSFDVATGDSAGWVHMWRRAEVVCSKAVVRGSVLCLRTVGAFVVVGGASGAIKLLSFSDAAGFELSSQVLLTPSPESLPATASGNGSQLARPGSSSSSSSSSRNSTARAGSAGGAGSGWQNLPRGSGDVLALCVARCTARGARGAGGVQVVAVDGHGRASKVLLEVGRGVGGTEDRQSRGPGAANDRNKRDKAMVAQAAARSAGAAAKPLFFFHTDTVMGLATDNASQPPERFSGSAESVLATCGDDRWLCLWGVSVDGHTHPVGRGSRSRRLQARAMLDAAGRCVAVDRSCGLLAVGLASGAVSLFLVDVRPGARGVAPETSLQAAGFRKDAQEQLSDVKFSPDAALLATASHDNNIYVYEVTRARAGAGAGAGASGVGAAPLRAELKPLHRLRGHASYVTHLDWSADSRLLQSNCGAYELLYWDVLAGKQLTGNSGLALGDTRWKSQTCVLGFGLMGIWAPNTDGTDVNAVDVTRDRSLVLTADDFGLVKLFNYPCVVKQAPYKVYPGHASHVSNCRFMGYDSMAATVGGADRSVFLWTVVHDCV